MNIKVEQRKLWIFRKPKGENMPISLNKGLIPSLGIGIKPPGSWNYVLVLNIKVKEVHFENLVCLKFCHEPLLKIYV